MFPNPRNHSRTHLIPHTISTSCESASEDSTCTYLPTNASSALPDGGAQYQLRLEGRLHKVTALHCDIQRFTIAWCVILNVFQQCCIWSVCRRCKSYIPFRTCLAVCTSLDSTSGTQPELIEEVRKRHSTVRAFPVAEVSCTAFESAAMESSFTYDSCFY